MPAQPVTVHLPANLARKLDQHAERLGRSPGSIVREAIADWLDREITRDQLTRKALESVDAGRLIDHERVEEWIDDLASAADGLGSAPR